ncbi:hypothetical protein cyc_08406 [Cyclospora cayetanensis]|uniref:Uncharacterized protein n=1 Tax=Cyclospora cayetanensis TaxID=88456 RepID=A0A1D3D102_9EIME|nr:hypothetical protein cyc_08406 [Cyclospora cayetanensis]
MWTRERTSWLLPFERRKRRRASPPAIFASSNPSTRWAACEEAAALCGFEDMGRLLKEADAYLQQQIISPTT